MKDRSGPQAGQRCAACGALNPPDALWCGQCLTRFDLPESPEQTPTSDPKAPDAESEPAATEAGAQARPRGPTRSSGAFVVGPEGITWKCAVCDSVNPLEVQHCSVCGAALAATLREPEPQRIARDPGKVALLSLFFPGAGHAYLGLWGQAIARAITSIWVLFVMLATGVQQGPAAPMPVLFGLASFGLWATTAHDAYREALGDPRSVLLKGRTFLYVVLGLIVLSVVMVFVTALGARPG